MCKSTVHKYNYEHFVCTNFHPRYPAASYGIWPDTGHKKGRTIWQAKISGRPNYPAGRTIWQAELSGRPNYLADRTIRQAELSGRPNCPAGRTIRQVRLFGQPDMVSDLSLIPFFPSSILLYYLLVPLNFVILNFT